MSDNDLREVAIKFTWSVQIHRFVMNSEDRGDLHTRLDRGAGIVHLNGKSYNVQNIAYMEIGDPV